MMAVIETKNLTKKYGHKVIIEDINLTLIKGDIYGLIGRNGAGKTTLMKLILGLSNPTNGEIVMLGSNDLEAARLKTGSLIENPTFYEKISAYSNMKIRAKLLGLENENKKIDEVLKYVELYDVRKEKPVNYSLGMKQRLGIAMALLGDPEILILDEPINGLDPIAIAQVRDTLLKINKEKKVTILISSHILGEMEKLATRYGFIVNGKLVSEITAKKAIKEKMDLEKHFIDLVGGVK